MAGEVWYFLAEIEAYNPDTSAVETLYFTDGKGFATGAADDPDDTYYKPRLLVPAGTTYGRLLFSDGTTGGASRIEVSDDIALNNADGALDDLIRYGVDSRAFRLYRIANGAARSTATLVLTGVMEQLLPNVLIAAGQAQSTLVIRLKDPLSNFDVPIQPAQYAGTNVGPAGLEGLEDDIKGLPKPVVYGRAYEVPLRPANASELIFQGADGAVAAFDAVYDNGVALVLDADYATPTLLAAATPASGEYATCLAYGYIMLGATPAGTITADISTVATALPSGDAVDLDGTDDRYTRTSAPVGGGATRVGIVNCWFRVDGGDGSLRAIATLMDGAGEVALRAALLTSNVIRLEWVSPSSASRGTLTSTSTYASGATWHHLLAAWDFDAGTGKLYIDGVDETNLSLAAADDIGPLGGGCQIGAQGTIFSPSGFWNGALAEIWIGWGQSLDLTSSGIRQRFRTAGGYPADLGSTGAKPTGTTPLVYLRGGPDAFETNLGSGGDFTKESAPTTASSTPYAPAPSAPATVTAAEIIRSIAQSRIGLLDAEIDIPAFDQAAVDGPGDVGIWIGDERSVRDVLDEVANSAALAYWFTSSGVLSIGRFGLPVGHPVITFTFAEIVEIEALPVYDVGLGLPTYSVIVEHRKIYTVQPGNGLAGSVSNERRSYLALEYRRNTPTSDNTVLAKHPKAPQQIFRTLITNTTDADSFAADRLTLYKAKRYRWRVQVKLDDDTAAVDLFDVVALRFDRFAHDGGKMYRVIGIETDFRAGLIDLDLWGGVVILIGAEGFRWGSFPAGRIGGLHGASIAWAAFPEGRVFAHLTGATIAWGAFPAGTVDIADVRITEDGDHRITESGDRRVTE